MYDITKCVCSILGISLVDFVSRSRSTFANLSRWLADAKALGSPHLVTVLVGNKSDREDDREVEWAEASRWAAQNGMCSQPRKELIYNPFAHLRPTLR